MAMAARARAVRQIGRDRSGASAVELALLLPAAFVLLLALLDLGRLGFVMATLDNAAQEGAEFASRRGPDSIAPATDAQVGDYVRARIHGAAPAEVAVTVTWSPAGAADRTVTVSAEHRFTFLANFFPMPALPVRGASSMAVL